jgi:hypothetical protein
MAFPPAHQQSLDRLYKWLGTSADHALAVSPHPPTPSSLPASPHPRKRARNSSVDDMDDGQSARSYDPLKGQRREDGSIVPSERATFSATSSVERTVSLSRYLIELRTAQPSVSLAPITMPPQPLSDDAMTRLGQLRRQLGDALKGKYIPAGLKDAIEQHPEFHLSLSMEPIEGGAFDYEDTRTLGDFALDNILQQVKRIFKSATLCAQFGRDENAWCFGVIWPLIELATRIRGESQWQPESV